MTKASGFNTKTFRGSRIGENFEWDFLDSFSVADYESYSWYTAAKTNGQFDAKKVLDKMLKRAYLVQSYEKDADGNVISQDWETVGLTSEMVDIRFDEYMRETGARRALALLTKGKKNEEALKALDSNIGRAALYRINYYEKFGKDSNGSYYSSGNYDSNFFEDILYVKDSDTLLKDSAPDKILFSYMGSNGEEQNVTVADIFAEKDNSSYYWNNFFYDNDIVRYDGNYTGGTRFTYGFSKTFYKNDTLDTSALLDYLFSYCNEDGSKEFRLSGFKDDETYGSLYSTSTDGAALEWLSSDVERMNLFGKVFFASSDYSSILYSYVPFMNFISKTCFIAGMDTKATYWNSGYEGWTDTSDSDKYYYGDRGIDYISIGDFTVNEKGLFGIYTNLSNSKDGWSSTTDNPYFYTVQIADNTGKITELQNKLPLPAVKVVGSQFYTERILLKCSLTDSSGSELGYHQVYAVDFDSGKVTNCFDNVPNRNGLEVVSFSSAGDLLYYSAVRGTTVENGIVDITTNEYAPLSVNRKMVAVYTFK